jgi:hypothetical protein
MEESPAARYNSIAGTGLVLADLVCTTRLKRVQVVRIPRIQNRNKENEETIDNDVPGLGIACPEPIGLGERAE